MKKNIYWIIIFIASLLLIMFVFFDIFCVPLLNPQLGILRKLIIDFCIGLLAFLSLSVSMDYYNGKQ